MKGLVYLASKRHPKLPNVPTAKELGYDVESCVNYWWLTTKGTPADRVATLAAAFKKATELPELRKTLTKRGVNVEFYTGAALMARMKANEKSLTAIAPKLK
jgi:tripartite-type tricarboxylate transporter receptor subunit TctC